MSTPRLLIIDSTRVGAPNATGQLKRTFLGAWRDGAFRQVFVTGGKGFGVARSLDDAFGDVRLAAEQILEDELAKFEPEVVYYRPTIDQHPDLHALAIEVLERYQVALVTQIMDDWPSRLASRDGDRAAELDASLRDVLRRSDKVLSISDKMSAVFAERYGMSFEPIANGVDPDVYREASAAAKPVKEQRDEFVLRYTGALADDMTFHTMVDVARAVDVLARELPLRFEVYTWEPWFRPFERAVKRLKSTVVARRVLWDEYPVLLARADALVLGYNFDDASISYVGLSTPNKLPEYLASGAAVLAVGPMEVNGIEYLSSRGLACCVTERNQEQLVAAIRRLAEEADYREQLAARAQSWAFDCLSVTDVSSRFQSILGEALEHRRERLPLLGPYSRAQNARIDESEVVAQLLLPAQPSGIMLDVGAHHGSSLRSFAGAGWKVVACEPDRANRAILADRFGGAAHVLIDHHAVSDVVAEATPFYSSTESTGISSLHAFHPSHRVTDTVDVTTVAGLVDAYGLTKVHFLKIDVEGLDLKVLDGVPWERIRPDVIECEFDDTKTSELGYTYEDLADGLAARGYAVYVSEWHPVVRYGIPHQWRQLARYPSALASPASWGNVIAFSDDPGPTAVSEAFAGCVAIETRGGVGGESSSSASRRPERVRARMVHAAGSVKSGRRPRRGALRARLRGRLSGSRRHPILVIRRFGAWVARKTQAYPLATAGYLLAFAILAALGFWPEFDPYGKLAWLAAGILALIGLAIVLAGFANFLVFELRSRVELQQQRIARRSDRDEDRLRAGLEERARADGLEEVGYGAEAARGKRVASSRPPEEIEAKLQLLEGEERARAAKLGVRIASLETKLRELSSTLEEVRERGVSLEIVSTLRRVRRLWGQPIPTDTWVPAATGAEHGHVVLMDLLVDEELRSPGVLTGRTLIEVGSTRERDPNQGSTEKLALFAELTGMRFATVDMDPKNTERARRVVRHLNPTAKAITARGEVFLAEYEQPIDYVYLDAFDFFHENHSLERHQRYREHLDTEINDRACWAMHQECAASIATKVSDDGIVVIDDTWVDEDGEYAGKGRLAVPLLIAAGFELIAEIPRAVGLKRSGRRPAIRPGPALDRERQA